MKQCEIPAVPQKWFGSAVCDTMYTIYLSLSTQTADLNLLRGTRCSENTIQMYIFLTFFRHMKFYYYSLRQKYKYIIKHNNCFVL